MRPISVAAPVATTTPRPAPCVTSVPDHSIGRRSPSAASGPTGSAPFSAGTDSPVRIASSADSPRASIRRRSAGMRSPASTSTMSPGTSAAPSTVTRRPSRSTAARGASICRIAAIAASALPSCRKPITALASTTARMTPVSTQCSSTAVTMAAPSSTSTSTLSNCDRNRRTGPRTRTSGSRFGPCTCNRRSASATESPCGPAVSRASTAAAGSAWSGIGAGSSIAASFSPR